MSLGEHLVELRKRLTIAAAGILVAAVIGFLVSDEVIKFLLVPIAAIADDRKVILAYTTLLEQFDLRFQIAFLLGILISSPVWLYQIFAFFVPGLTKREKRFTFGFFFSAVPLFLGGAAVGFLIFPHMVTLLTSFNSSALAVTNLSARPYYDFVIKLVLACGVAFVLPVFLVLLNFAGILSAASILKGWRVAILIITLFCATATPAVDIVSMFILAIPMVILYFAAAGIAWWHDRAVARREAALVAEATA
ncbi:MAG: twin-arginine translocase subunit TatC [Microbacteriaceae bacterium]